MKIVATLILTAALCCAAACSERHPTAPAIAEPQGMQAETGSGGSADAIGLRVYKSPTCGCCGDWIEHLEQSGFSVGSEHPDDLAALKDELGVPVELRSCHTAVSSAGYVFEGHVPARFIHQFLQSPRADAIGLSVAGMPLGSPGMEQDGQFTPYRIMLLKRDGTSEVYATLQRYDEQF